MFTAILLGYMAIATGVASATFVRLGRQRGRRDEHIDGADRIVLMSVAIVSSLVWPILLVIYTIGWLGSTEARAFFDRLARLLRLRRSPAEPVHRAAG